MLLHQLVRKVLYNTRFTIHGLPFSTSLPSAENLAIKPPFAVEYLVKSCGLSMDKAINASRQVPNLKSPAKPDSILQFLRQTGLGSADIRKTVAHQPKILCASLENTIKPRMEEIREIGFSPSQVARLVPLVPIIFRSKYNSLQRAVAFWASVFGSLEGILIALKRSSHLLTVSLDKVVKPNISFLEGQCGVSPNQIRIALMRASELFTSNPNKLKKAAQKAEMLGIPQGGGLFIYALQVAVTYSAGNLEAKMDNLKNLGFSKEEIDLMIKKQPMLLTNSDERIRQSVLFLASEAGLDLPYIANHPILISFSIERRIIPRLYVIKSLESKGLCENLSLTYVMNLSEKKFGERFVKPHKDIIPEVIEAYEAARAGKISLKGKL